MANDENFPPLPARKPRDSVTKITSMETESIPSTTNDTAKCEQMLTLFESIQLQEDRLAFIEHTLMKMRTGRIRKVQANFDSMTKNAEDLRSNIQHQKGELVFAQSIASLMLD
ncbi:hypothetical protein TNCV_1791151 [Trichonephila clavipes]|nr:hypothetical protein TNCV_1791151 [Trichonephila clavipes]